MTRIDANDESDHTSTTGESPEVLVSPSESCVLELRVLDEPGAGADGGHKFKLLGVDIQAVHPQVREKAAIGVVSWR